MLTDDLATNGTDELRLVYHFRTILNTIHTSQQECILHVDNLISKTTYGEVVEEEAVNSDDSLLQLINRLIIGFEETRVVLAGSNSGRPLVQELLEHIDLAYKFSHYLTSILELSRNNLVPKMRDYWTSVFMVLASSYYRGAKSETQQSTIKKLVFVVLSLAILLERIAGRFPAWEGIRIVRERIPDNELAQK
jgi:hypothetical protein